MSVLFEHVRSPPLPNMLNVVHKLPQYLQNKWHENVAKARRDGNIPNFQDLASFVTLAAETANDTV